MDSRVLPAFRGRGLAASLVLHGIDTLRARGAARYVGSCSIENAPMIAVFRRLGCVEIARQQVFVLDDPPGRRLP